MKQLLSTGAPFVLGRYGVRYDGDRVVKQLGKRIAALRSARDISQGGLAERIGSTPQWISQLERGTRSPTVHTLVKLANALDVSLGELLDSPIVATSRQSRH